MSSRMIAQGQALRVASQALPDHPRLHERDSSGWENIAALPHLIDVPYSYAMLRVSFSRFMTHGA
jgi:hypothetical protein